MARPEVDGLFTGFFNDFLSRHPEPSNPKQEEALHNLAGIYARDQLLERGIDIPVEEIA
jgi:hypothetical protein